MKSDKLLQHQLVRLNAILQKRNPDCYYPSSVTREWVARFCDIYHRAICRSLTRFANGGT
jgi:hypothetical protein